MRVKPKLLSELSVTFDLAIGCQKLGQPVPDSNFVAEFEQRRVAADAAIEPARMLVPIGAGESALGAGLARHLIGLGRELRAPFRRGFDDLRHALRAEACAGGAERFDEGVAGGGAGGRRPRAGEGGEAQRRKRGRGDEAAPAGVEFFRKGLRWAGACVDRGLSRIFGHGRCFSRGVCSEYDGRRRGVTPSRNVERGGRQLCESRRGLLLPVEPGRRRGFMRLNGAGRRRA